MDAIVLDPFRGNKACVRNGALLLNCPCLGCLDVSITLSYRSVTPGNGHPATELPISGETKRWWTPTFTHSSSELDWSNFTLTAKGTGTGPFAGPCPTVRSLAGTIFNYSDPGSVIDLTFAAYERYSQGAIDSAGSGYFRIQGRDLITKTDEGIAYRGGSGTEYCIADVSINSGSARCKVTVGFSYSKTNGGSLTPSSSSLVVSGTNVTGYKEWSNDYTMTYSGGVFSSSTLWRGINFGVTVERI